MSSFGVKNILLTDNVTYDIFFNKSEEVVDYYHCNYKHLPREDVVKFRIIQNSTKIVLDCMKQNFMVLTPNDPVYRKEYLCSCNSCI